jgi:hypothetical protein
LREPFDCEDEVESGVCADSVDIYVFRTLRLGCNW